MNLLSFLINLFITTTPTANREYFNTTEGSVAKVIEGNVVFHAFKQPETTYTTNIIELPTQLVIIDFGLTVSGGEKALRYAKTLNKPKITCLLTHYHPDHFTGYEAWKNACTSTFALNETIAKVKEFFVESPNDFQASAISFVNAASMIQPGVMMLDNVEFVLERVENIETDFFLFVVMTKQQAMFCGDIVTNNDHYYLADNHDLAPWLVFLYELKLLAYRNVFNGHGFPVDWSTDVEYIKAVIYFDFVRNVASTYKTKEEYTSAIIDRFPNYGNRFVVSCPFSCP